MSRLQLRLGVPCVEGVQSCPQRRSRINTPEPLSLKETTLKLMDVDRGILFIILLFQEFSLQYGLGQTSVSQESYFVNSKHYTYWCTSFMRRIVNTLDYQLLGKTCTLLFFPPNFTKTIKIICSISESSLRFLVLPSRPTPS